MRPITLIAWLPLAILPVGVMVFAPADWPPWAFMWMLAGSIYAGCKWLTWTATPVQSSLGRQVGYLVLWPGLDASAFLGQRNLRTPSLLEWWFAIGKFALGVAVTVIVVPAIPADSCLARGWAGMIGIVFALHFGLFHLLSLTWLHIGIDARPIMDWPMRATSVSEFWGRRWNTAFRDLTHRFLFRPLSTYLGAKAALVVGFVLSGLVHDLVISLPAGAGFGGPTVFFLIQAAAVVLERSTLGQHLGLMHGPRSWTFTMLVLLVPIPLLFHPPFVCTVVTPFVEWLLSPVSFGGTHD